MTLKHALAVAMMASLSAVAAAAPYSPTGAGQSTIGVAGDYPTLGAAVAAINTAHPIGVNRDDGTTWTFLITEDLTETANVALAVNAINGSRIVFRPAPNTTPTINFNTQIDNGGLSGHWLIGTRSISSALISAIGSDTAGITIDGSNTVGGTTRDLTLTNTGPGHTFASIVAITHGASDIEIRNTNIINNHSVGAGTSVSAISIRSRYETTVANSLAPLNLVIENNLLRSIAAGQGVAINAFNSGTVVNGVAPTGYVITNNDMEARIRGIFANPLAGGTISNNRITIGLGGTTAAISTFGIIWNSVAGLTGQTINITGNDVAVSTNNASANNGPTGLFLASMGSGNTINVINNEVTVTAAADAPTANLTFIRGIATTSLINYNIQHNSVRIGGLTNYNGPFFGNSYGIGGFNNSTAPDVRNNVVHTDVPGSVALAAGTNGDPFLPTTFVSDFNILSAVNGASAVSRQTGFTITNRAINAGVATLTIGTHAIPVGTEVTVTFNTPNANYDGVRTITATAGTTISFATTGGDQAALATAAFQGFVVVSSQPAYATAAAWNADQPTLDANSNSLDPTAAWTSATNLRILAVPGDTSQWGGTPLAAVTTDIDGNVRNAVHPYRGSSEGPTLPLASTGEWMMLAD